MPAEPTAPPPLEDTDPLRKIEQKLEALSGAIQQQTLAEQGKLVLESNITRARELVKAAEAQFLKAELDNAGQWFRDMQPGDTALVLYQDIERFLKSPVLPQLKAAAGKANINLTIYGHGPVYSATPGHPTKPFSPGDSNPPQILVPICYRTSVTTGGAISFSHTRLNDLLEGSKTEKPTLLQMLKELPEYNLTFLLACDPEHLRKKLQEFLVENPPVYNILKTNKSENVSFLKEHGRKNILDLSPNEREEFFKLLEQQKFEDPDQFRVNKEKAFNNDILKALSANSTTGHPPSYKVTTLINYTTATQGTDKTAAAPSIQDEGQPTKPPRALEETPDESAKDLIQQVASDFTNEVEKKATQRQQQSAMKAASILLRLWQDLARLFSALLPKAMTVYIRPLIIKFEEKGYTTRAKWGQDKFKNGEWKNQKLDEFFRTLLQIYFLQDDSTAREQILNMFKKEAEDSALKTALRRLLVDIMENVILLPTSTHVIREDRRQLPVRSVTPANPESEPDALVEISFADCNGVRNEEHKELRSYKELLAIAESLDVKSVQMPLSKWQELTSEPCHLPVPRANSLPDMRKPGLEQGPTEEKTVPTLTFWKERNLNHHAPQQLTTVSEEDMPTTGTPGLQ